MTDPSESPQVDPPAPASQPAAVDPTPPREAAGRSAEPSRPEPARPEPTRHALERWAESGIARFGAPGRADAKRSKVVAIDVKKGLVIATVRLAKKGLVDVSIEMPLLVESAWNRVAEVFAMHTLAVARLLAGDLPEIFLLQLEERGVSLLPPFDAAVVARCDCDESLPGCDHRAAVVELLAEEIARDPFVLFLLRGRERPEVLALLGDEDDAPAIAGEAGAADLVEPLPGDPEQFWAVSQPEPVHLGEVKEPEVPAVLVRRLGEFPFWRGSRLLLPALERMYRRASKAAIETLRGA